MRRHRKTDCAPVRRCACLCRRLAGKGLLRGASTSAKSGGAGSRSFHSTPSAAPLSASPGPAGTSASARAIALAAAAPSFGFFGSWRRCLPQTAPLEEGLCEAPCGRSTLALVPFRRLATLASSEKLTKNECACVHLCASETLTSLSRQTVREERSRGLWGKKGNAAKCVSGPRPREKGFGAGSISSISMTPSCSGPAHGKVGRPGKGKNGPTSAE